MESAETLRAYRSFLEYRVLKALEGRRIAYWADVTGVLTRALCELGRHFGHAVTVEKRYDSPAGDASNLRSDVHWRGEAEYHWEIDRTVKNASAEKLAAAGPGEKYWVLWAQDNDLLSLGKSPLAGINVVILGYDVRKRIWERLAFEREERASLQETLARPGRFDPALALEAALERARGSGAAGGAPPEPPGAGPVRTAGP